MEGEKLKIAWICHFSNPEMRNKLNIEMPLIVRILRYVLKKNDNHYKTDESNFVTAALKEFKDFDSVDLHVICVVDYLTSNEVRYTEGGIHYYFFKNEIKDISYKLKRDFNLISKLSYPKNCAYVKQVIEEINPKLIHLIGAETPYYSSTILDLPKTRPILVQLQTLMNDPEFLSNYNISKESYEIHAAIERSIICKADYIGTIAEKFIPLITKYVKPEATIINTTLALTEKVDLIDKEKKYDFVYFAANIGKAVDWAIEAFGEASKIKESITLDIIGDFSDELKKQLDNRIKELGVENQVFFEGRLPSHDDVLKQIKLSRFALLPLKIDLVSCTIREAMANGLPTVTTITPDTPKLNKKRECILLSKPRDFKAMAMNMVKLLEDETYANTIRDNAIVTVSEATSNKQLMLYWIEAYKVLIDNFYNGTSIPESFISK